MRTITPFDYDRDIIRQGLQFQIDKYFFPAEEYMRRRVEIVLSALKPRKGERLLDLGCGVGTFAFHCSRHGVFSAGVDYSYESVKAAAQLCARFPVLGFTGFINADATALPLKNGLFDKIAAIDFIEHLTDEHKEIMLEELIRVMRPSATLVVYTPNGIREKISQVYWRLRCALFGGSPPFNELHFGLISRVRFENMLRKRQLHFACTYVDIDRPYLCRLPLLRHFLAQNLLWIIEA